MQRSKQKYTLAHLSEMSRNKTHSWRLYRKKSSRRFTIKLRSWLAGLYLSFSLPRNEGISGTMGVPFTIGALNLRVLQFQLYFIYFRC